MERGRLVPTGIADVPSARRASCPPVSDLEVGPTRKRPARGQDARDPSADVDVRAS